MAKEKATEVITSSSGPSVCISLKNIVAQMKWLHAINKTSWMCVTNSCDMYHIDGNTCIIILYFLHQFYIKKIQKSPNIGLIPPECIGTEQNFYKK